MHLNFSLSDWQRCAEISYYAIWPVWGKFSNDLGRIFTAKLLLNVINTILITSRLFTVCVGNYRYSGIFL